VRGRRFAAVLRRGLQGQHPQSPDEIIAGIEATAGGWNAHPTPFLWGGKRRARRERARQRPHRIGGSGACIEQPLAIKQVA